MLSSICLRGFTGRICKRDRCLMGCRTGFYLILVGEYCENQIAEGLKNSLNKY